MPPVRNLLGQRFGRRVAIARAPNGKNGAVRWLMRCDCGRETIAWKKSLREGRAQSCGCLQKERARANSTRHNKCHAGAISKVYRAWQNMKSRAFNPSRAHEKRYYTSRGIGVWPGWLNSFEAFYEEIGDPPSSKHSLDRIDNNRSYEPGNIRWATPSEQCKNSRPRQRKTHCKRGHPLEDVGERQICRTCRNEWKRMRRQHKTLRHVDKA